MHAILFFSLAVSALALGYSFLTSRWLLKKDAGSSKMQEIATAISTGVDAFLKAEYKVVGLFVLLSTLPITYMCFFTSYMVPSMLLTYILGVLCSALAGYIGIYMAVRTNVRTAQAARTSLWEAFRSAFCGGSVMGMSVVGLVLLGMSSIFLISFGLAPNHLKAVELAVQRALGFALGSQVYALFARVAGGIYTKSADIGADMVGKLEASLPEDDMRNPAVIADNVGDNVGDNAGAGADIFSSLTAVMVGSMCLGKYVFPVLWKYTFFLPSLVTAFYLIKIGVSHLCFKKYQFGMINHKLDAGKILLRSLQFPGLILAPFLAQRFIYTLFVDSRLVTAGMSMVIGMGVLVGIAVGWITMYFTQQGKRPVDFIIKQSTAGAGNNLIAGLSVGMLSAVVMGGFFAITIWLSYYISGIAGVAVFGVGVLSCAVMYLTVDAFGPIVDNAGGIVEMAGMEGGEVVRKHTDVLDVAGNTTAASGKGFSMASAAIASILLFAVYTRIVGDKVFSLSDPYIFLGILIGAGVPYLFSALTISAVGRASLSMVDEVRRQFRELPGILKGQRLPDYARCITIATHAALRQMWLPGILAIGLPISVGFFLGAKVLGAYVVGVTLSGILLGIFQCNAGGAWDNSKKAFERGLSIEGKLMGKDSSAYHAAVVGDTVGDPLKDTSGPSMNILIKLTGIIALLMAPYLS